MPIRYSVKFKTSLHDMPRGVLFGLKFTNSNSASEWALRSFENYSTLGLPETFEELQKVPLDRTYNFLMSLDKDSIN